MAHHDFSEREATLIDAVKGLMVNPIENGEFDSWCRYCERSDCIPHADDCPYVVAGRLLAELGEPIEEN